jgi:ribosomal protein S17E
MDLDFIQKLDKLIKVFKYTYASNKSKIRAMQDYKSKQLQHSQQPLL